MPGIGTFVKADKSGIKKVVGSILGGEDIDELDFKKSFEKYNNLYKISCRYRDIFLLLSRTRTLEKFKEVQDTISSYFSTIDKNIKESLTFSENLEKINLLYERHPILTDPEKDEMKAFLRFYNEAKKAPVIHTIINTCGNLIPYKSYLKDKDTLDDKFLLKSSMMTFNPISDLEFNFKLIYISDLIDKKEKSFLLLTLHKLYTITVEMYEEYSKVDIDTEQFVRAVRSTVEKLKKQIPRCEEAFKKILDSTELLKDNYSDYYKDYVGSNNSMIIAENFIQDVAGTVDRSPRLALQFRKIIQHLKDMSTKLIAHDPKYKATFSSLLNQADQSYEEIKKAMKEDGELVEEEEEEEDDNLKEVFDEMANKIIEEDKRKKENGEEDTDNDLSNMLDNLSKNLETNEQK